MKTQLVKLFSILALVISVPAIANIAQARPHHGYGRIADGRMGKHLEDLNLTVEQKAKMEQLRQSSRKQIEALLDPEQLKKFQQIEAQRQSSPRGENRLNLTADQKTQLQAIRKANKSEFQAILTPAQKAQLPQEGGWRRGGMDKLNLTAEQKAKMAQLKATSRSRMDAILTPEQQQQSKLMRDRRQSMRETWKSLNLTADQQGKMKAIHQASEEQFKAILTPEQQTKLKSHRGGRRHHAV
jgi:periplasmic protein CpxP/Spy